MHSVVAPAPVQPEVTPPARTEGTAAVPQAPYLLVAVSLLVVAGATALAVTGALRTGITWDEPFHVMRLRSFLEDGWFALDWTLQGDGPVGETTNTAVYAPVAMLLLHGLGVLVGAETWGTVSADTAAYDVRHLGVVVIGLVGTAAAAAIGRRLLGSWRWGLVTAAVLLALPMWTGHLMFNIKDVPVATGYTLMTLALVSIARPVRVGGAFRVLGLAAGVVLMVGTRPAMWTAVAAGLVTLAAGALAVTSNTAATTRRRTAREALLGLGMSALVLVSVYPNLFAHPERLLSSAAQSASFRDGREAVPGYVAFFVAAQTPLLLLGFSLAGIAVVVRFVVRRHRTDAGRATALALVVVQLIALPLASTLMLSDLYNALRQLLFAAPAWAVLTTYGVAYALERTRTSHARRWVGAVAAAALVLPTVDQVTQFPYQYTYFNVALDASGIHVASDYWRASVPELAGSLPTDGPVVCSPTRSGPEDDPEAQTANRFSVDSSVDCRTDALGPLAPGWAEAGRPLGDSLPREDFYAIVDRDHPVPVNCRRLAGVTRERHLRTIAMTYVARCTLGAPRLDEREVGFSQDADEATMLPELWAYAPLGWVMRGSRSALDASGTAASLTFEATDGCASARCGLLLDADAPADLQAHVDDVPVAVRRVPDGVLVDLPPGTRTAWVTFSRPGDLPLELRLRAIRLALSSPLPDPGGSA